MGTIIDEPLNEVDISELEDILNTNKLVLWNDNHNDILYVIKAVIDICKVSFEQAEQCVTIVHYKGKYAIKEGSMDKLKPMKEAFQARGLEATID